MPTNRLNQTEPALYLYLWCSVAIIVPFSSISRLNTFIKYNITSIKLEKNLFGNIVPVYERDHTMTSALDQQY